MTTLLAQKAHTLFAAAPSRSENFLPDLKELSSFSDSAQETIRISFLSLFAGANPSEVKSLLIQIIEEERKALKQAQQDAEEVVRKYRSFGPTNTEYLKADPEISEDTEQPVEWDEDDDYVAYLGEVSRRKREADGKSTPVAT
ncbi:hypothetical protein HDV00_007409 [Rhizophlyctis rosea]|nr:hypothetical protein HDV00_007409 [Rhizophlyctis rosea]